MFNFLLADLAPNWVVNSFPVIKFVLLLFILVASVSLVVVVMMQQSEGGNTVNSITGLKDTYFSKNKGLNREVRLRKFTAWLSIFIAVATVIFFVMTLIYGGSLWS